MLTAKQLDAKFPKTKVAFPKKEERLGFIKYKELIKSIQQPPKTKGLSFVMASTDMTLHESYKKKAETKTLTDDEIFDIIIRVVGEVYKTEKIIRADKSRKRNIIDPRYTVIFLVRYTTRLSLAIIGKKISPQHPMDHSTIIHSCKTVMARLEAEDYDFCKNFAIAINSLIKTYGIEINMEYSERMPEWYKIMKQNG